MIVIPCSLMYASVFAPPPFDRSPPIVMKREMCRLMGDAYLLDFDHSLTFSRASEIAIKAWQGKGEGRVSKVRKSRLRRV